MTVTAPETVARHALIAMLETTYAADGVEVRDDKLHASLGDKGTLLGVFTNRSTAGAANKLFNEYELVVQFYGSYLLEVKREQTVSPGVIENYAERFRRALQVGVDPRTGAVWYFELIRVVYPDDPTGNKSRFEAFVLARGNNAALIETVG